MYSFTASAACIAKFGYTTTGLDVSVIDSSTGVNKWIWFWGDGNSIVGKYPPTYSYATSGTYNIKLVVQDTSLGCKDSIIKTVNVSGGAAHCNNFIQDADETGIDCGGIDCSPCGGNHCTNGFQDADETGIDCGGIDCSPCGGNHCTNAIKDADETDIDCGGIDCSPCGGGGCNAYFAFTTDTSKTAIFTDMSSYAKYWKWNFGDGSAIDTLQSPSYTYAIKDTYNVCLTIKDSAQTCSSTVCKNVIVGQAGGGAHCYNAVQDADETGIDCGGIDCSPCGGGGGCNAYFSFTTDTSKTAVFTDASTYAKYWMWDFGDGSAINTLQSPSYTYAIKDTYNVCLTIKDSAQTCSSTVCKNVIVGQGGGGNHCTNGFQDADETGIDCGGIDCSPCGGNHCTNAIKDADETDIDCGGIDCSPCGGGGGCNAYFAFTTDTSKTAIFTDMSSYAKYWMWDFGDGSAINNLQSPTYTYAIKDTFNVCLTIKDSVQTCSSTVCKNVIVGQASGGAHCYNAVQDADETGIDCGGIDCSPCSGNHCTNGFQDADETGIDCGGIDCAPCGGGGGCNAYFTFTTDTSKTATFTDMSTYAKYWNWDFGDGSAINNLQSPSYTYAIKDTFIVCLTIKDSAQTCSSTVCKDVIVGQAGGGNHCYNGFKDVDEQGVDCGGIDCTPCGGNHCTNGFQDADETGIDCGGVDCSPCSGNHCTNGFQDADETGIDCGGIDCAPCGGGGGCYAEFIFYTDTTTNVSFTDKSMNAMYWFWDFGDANTSALANPNHTYAIKDTYNVCLTIKDSAQICSSTVCKIVIVGQSGSGNHCTNGFQDADETGIDCGGVDCSPCGGGGNCYAEFIFYTDTTTNVSFTDKSMNAKYWFWDFGDANTSTLGNPNHTYAIKDTYNVCLTIKDSAQICSSMVCKNVVVGQGGGGNHCYNGFKDVDEQGVDCGGIDCTPCTGGHCTNAVQDADETGIDCGGIDCAPCGGGTSNCMAYWNFNIDTFNIYILSFQDFSTSDSTIISWAWTFGDGTSSTLQNPQHTYATNGSKWVNLHIEAKGGCMRDYGNWITVGGSDHCTNGIMDMDETGVDCGGFDCIKCAGCNVFADFMDSRDPVDKMKLVFNNYSQGNIVKAKWDFGDGVVDTINIASTSHKYSYTGGYNICLTVKDSSGCVGNMCRWIQLDTLNQCDIYAYFNYTTDTTDPSIMTMKFENLSGGTNAPNSYYWQFGDGGSSMLKNPVHKYTMAGSYMVNLSVTDTVSKCNQMYSMNIMIGSDTGGNVCFTSSYFTFAPDTAGNGVRFYNNSTNYSIANWDFGDGTFSNVLSPNHVYANPGYYWVCLTVKDTNNCLNSYCMNVKAGNDVNACFTYASFTFFPDQTGNGMSFSNSSSGYNKVQWDFGDGSFDYINSNPYHLYANSGYYNVCLTVRDSSNGCMNNMCNYVKVGNDTIGGGGTTICYSFADFSSMPNGGNSVLFNNHSQGYTSSYWEFGDGTFSELKNPSHDYAGPGYYYVCLSIFDSTNGCQQWFCKNIKAGEDTNSCFVYANFIYGPGTAKNEILFTTSSPGNNATHWDFGDGGFSDVKNPSHIFSNSGYYTVCLSVKDTVKGCMDYWCNYIKVGNDSFGCYTYANFNYFPDPATSGGNFSNISMGYTNAYWDFGDGNTSNMSNPYHNYTTSGYYTVCLTVSDSATGCQNNVCQYIHVGQDTLTNFCYTYSYFTYFPGTTANSIVFNNESQGYNNVTWDFGDGNFSSLTNPTYSFAKAGYYNVCLTVRDSSNGCMANWCNYIAVGNDTSGIYCYSYASFTFFPDVNGGTSVQFNNNSMGYNSVFWDFGDGNFSSGISPNHAYLKSGYYNVCLTVRDSANGCMNNMCNYIKVGNDTTGGGGGGTPICFSFADFSSMPNGGNSVIFNNQSRGYTSSYWEFGDGTFSDQKNPAHTYSSTGYYYVCLSIFDSTNGCQQWFCKNIKVGEDSSSCFVYANFMYSPGTATNEVLFTTSSPGNNATHWDFGDGGFSDVKNPSHIFKNSGYYTVCLSVRDTVKGCMDYWCNYIKVGNDSSLGCYTYASFNYFPDPATSGGNFSNMSMGYTNAYWDFGDGNTSNMSNPYHSYTTSGYYTVCLTVSDSATGCQNNMCQYIHVGQDTLTNFCYTYSYFTYFPGSKANSIVFNNESQGYNKVMWDFGDGTFSNITSPTHDFAKAGYYNVCLTVRDSINGCMQNWCNYIAVGNDTSGFYCYSYSNFTFFPDANGGNSVQFNNNSMGYNSVFWNFGDGSNSNQISPSHAYAKAGYYDVCLTVFDTANNCQNNWCMYIKVGMDTLKQYCYTYSSFTAYPDFAGTGVWFSNTSMGVSGLFWDFGDGGSSFEWSPYHTYAKPGYYNVCLSVFDTLTGCQAFYCNVVRAGDDSTTCYTHAQFGFFPDASGNGVWFNNNSYGFTDIFWDLGDGTSSTEWSPYHVYASGGYYDVCLTIYDSTNGCQDQWCSYVKVGNDQFVCNSYAQFSFFPDTNNNKVSFKNQSNGNITQVFWDFGDGSFSKIWDPIHNYPNPGYYNVCLTVFDSTTGCQAFYCNFIQIFNTNVQNFYTCFANFSFYPSPNNGNLVKFNNLSGGNLTNVHWEFGDGNFSDLWSPDHYYSKPGYYYVCLTVFDSTTGCMNYMCNNIQIFDNSDTTFVGCFTNFTWYPDVNNGYNIHFNDASGGSFTSYYWNFGDGMSSNYKAPVHTYPQAGYYNVCLTVFDSVSGCMANYCDWVVLDDSTYGVDHCYADFGFYPNGKQVQFNDFSKGNVNNWFWEFGDGQVAYDQNPVHNYAKYGYYWVCLTTFDPIQKCHASWCNFVEIFDPADTTFNDCYAKFSQYADPSTNTVYFNDKSYGSFTSWFWEFGDGYTSYAQNPSHVYPRPGYFDVYLTVFDSVSGCVGFYWDYVIIYDSNYVDCKAAFAYYPDPNASTVYFENNSTGKLTEVFWEFGDGTVSTKWDATHDFAKVGYYDVCLSIYDSVSGCMNWRCELIHIGGDSAIANDCEAYYTKYADTSGKVFFTDNSYGSFTEYYWEFGDGTSSFVQNPSHAYTLPGYYYVCLVVFDSVSNCIDYYCEGVQVGGNSAIDVDCFADFSYKPKGGGNVKFKSNSKGTITDIFWDFGDGQVSNDLNPNHLYSNLGFYTVCLSVFNNVDSCVSNICKTISVFDSTTSNCKSQFAFYPKDSSTTVSFKDQSHGNVTSWYWDFGDMSVAGTEQNPKYTYSEAGIYEVCLTIGTANGCQSTYCKVIQVGDGGDDCYAFYSYFADSLTATAYFNNQSLGQLTKYTWEFGDDTTFVSNQKNPGHTYPDIGVYPACLTVENAVGCVSTFCDYVNIGNDLANKCEFSCVWPGDANNDLEANHYDILTLGLNYGETGPRRDSVSTRWIGHFGQDWSTFQVDGTNNKHGDCNGDGIIDMDDTLAIEKNFGYSHPKQYGKSRNASNPDLYFEITGDIAPGSTVEVAIMANQGGSSTSLYGIGFEVTIGDNMMETNSASVSYANSWLGSDNNNMLTVDAEDYGQGDVYVGMVRNDQTNQTGQGELARVEFTVASTVSVGDTLNISLTTEYGMDSNGDTITFNGSTGSSVTVGSSEQLPMQLKQVTLYPNPTQGNVSFELPAISNTDLYELSVINTVGQVVKTITYNKGGVLTFDISTLQNGIYYVQIISGKTMYQDKLNLVK